MQTDHQHRRGLRRVDRSNGHLNRRYKETKGVDRPDGTWSRLLAPVVQLISTRSLPDIVTEKLGRQRQLLRGQKCFRRACLGASNAMKTIDQLPRALGASTRVCRCMCSFRRLSDLRQRDEPSALLLAVGPHSLLVPGPQGRAQTDQRQMRDRWQPAHLPRRLSAAVHRPGRWLFRMESD